MMPIPDIRVTLALGERSMTLCHAELVELLGHAVTGRLIATVASAHRLAGIHSAHGERGGWGSLGPPPRSRTQNAFAYPVSDSESVPSVRGEGSRGEETDARESLAAYLAERLQDPRSLAFYRKVAARVPPEIVRDCLARALDVPRRDVRRSHGALFTKLVLPHLRRFSS